MCRVLFMVVICKLVHFVGKENGVYIYEGHCLQTSTTLEKMRLENIVCHVLQRIICANVYYFVFIFCFKGIIS